MYLICLVVFRGVRFEFVLQFTLWTIVPIRTLARCVAAWVIMLTSPYPLPLRGTRPLGEGQAVTTKSQDNQGEVNSHIIPARGHPRRASDLYPFASLRAGCGVSTSPPLFIDAKPYKKYNKIQNQST